MILNGFLFTIGAIFAIAFVYFVLGAIYEMYTDWKWKQKFNKKASKK